MSLEQAALDDLLDQRPDAAALLLGQRDDPRHLVAVAEGDLPARRVAGELLGEILQKAGGVGCDQGLELGDAAERAAVRHLTRGVDLRAELEADADERIDRPAR